ncbi:hypothetical protein [Streptomyces apricus]|uniref:Uncharacterized protein n=1 Tax=Streptomyces apricus TaxID=1828112 RepID=A0A5B0BJW1_9ACTN|nr:hypothetical protein [Streptomyces apricus]KAA0941956.1 hypothetical protein FGF04_04090 [Streptomyces apricus]
MPAPTRKGSAFLAAATAVLLTTGLSLDAQAATGVVRYFSLGGQEFRITDPPDNTCLTLQVPAELIANQTNRTMSTYSDTICANLIVSLEPGRSAAHIGGPRSVRLVG